ncbi:MAG: hypothetical protein ACYS8Z_09965 [Planctomycetota bacterium]
MKMIKPTFHILTFVWLAAAVSGCAMGSANISDGRYTSPLNNFSLPIPRFAFGWQLTENNDTQGGYVSFHGDMGALYAVHYMLVSPSDAEIYDDAVLRDRVYSSYLHDDLLPNIFRRSPRTEVIHEEFLGQDKGREFFAVVNIPGGSPLIEMNSGTNFDSTRAILIFKAVSTLYMLHYELGDPLHRTEEFSLDEKTLGRARDNLHRFQESIDFR